MLAPYKVALRMRAGAAPEGAEQAHKNKADPCGQLRIRNVFAARAGALGECDVVHQHEWYIHVDVSTAA